MDFGDEYIPTILRDEPEKPVEKRIMYAIGIAHKPHEFGMTHGVTPVLQEMLEVIGQPKSCILQLNPDGTHIILWRWNEDRWVKM